MYRLAELWNRVSIRKKVFVALGGSLAALLVFLGAMYWATATNGERLALIQDRYYPVLEKVDRNIARLKQIRDSLKMGGASGEMALVDNAADTFERVQHDFRQIQETAPRYEAEVAKLQKKAANYFRAGKAVSRRMIEGNRGEEFSTRVMGMQSAYEEIADSLQSFREARYQEFVGALNSANRTAQQGLTWGIVLGLLTLWATLWVAFAVRSVVNRIGHTSAFLDKRAGDFALDERLPEVGNDELTRMARAFNGLMETLRRSEEDLKQAKEEAEEANRTKSAFLANMSHELRTPLNAVIGYSEMLLEDAEDLEQDEFTPDLKKIQSAGKHLLSLINDILDISKIEAGKMEIHPETFDLDEEVQGVVTTVEPLVGNNDNELVVDTATLGEVNADATKVRQILLNLLSNAAKFTHEGTITLSGQRVAGEGGDRLRLSVADSGIGMRPDQLQKLFAAFTQADSSTTREYGGTGLGLAISRRFARMMGGDITVESEEGVGTTFTLDLPADVANAPALEAEEEAAGETAAATAETLEEAVQDSSRAVLVVDDDATVRDLLTRHLARAGYEVVSASSGSEGLRLARELQPAAITLDVMMPGKDGWAVLGALKEDPATRSIPVVMLTMVDDKKKAYHLGATEFLTKPVDRSKLLDVLGRSVDQASTVLVAEDSEETREVFRRILEKEGCEVMEAENGRRALERLEEKHPDIILLDLMMPEVDGFTFLDEFHQRADWQGIPVVVVTAKELTDDERSHLNGRVGQILTKGGNASVDGLVDEVQSQLGNLGDPQTATTTDAD